MPIKHEWNGTILTITSDSGTSSADLQGAKGATGARGARGLTGRTGGGALIEDGVIRDDTTWSSAGIMDRFAEAFGSTGNPVVCNNALANVPFNIITEFEVKQEGSGNPYPAGTGKNILPYPYASTTKTANGLTITDNGDGSLTLNGTATALTDFNLTKENQLDLGSEYWYGAKSGTTKGDYTFSLYDADGNHITTGLNIRYMGTSNKVLQVRILDAANGGGITYSNYVIYPQIEAGTTATAYEPYSNIRPIIGYDNISITRSGKNICPGVVMGAAYMTKDGTFNTNQPSYTSTNKFVVAEGVNYIDSTDNNTSLNRKTFHYWNDKGEWLGVWKGTEGYTLNNRPVGAVMAAITYYNPDATQIAKWAQIEVGEIATAYEPYKADSYSITLGDTYYQGSIDWNTGKIIVDMKGIALTGNEDWKVSKVGDGTYRQRLYDVIADYKAPEATNIVPNLICSHYTATTADKVYTSYQGVSLARTGNIIDFYDSNYNTNDANRWKAYLTEQYNAGKPIQVVYELAEPQAIQLEPLIIKALSGTNTLTTNADNIDLVGRYDTAKTIKELLERVAALEAKVGE